MKIVAIVIARPVMDVEQMNNAYLFDPEGKYLYVDCAVTSSPHGLKLIVLALLKRFGQRMAGFWHRRNGTLKGYAAEKLLSKVLTVHKTKPHGPQNQNR